MKTTIMASTIAAVLLVSTASAQEWQGGYVGGHAGSSSQSGNSSERVVFDTTLDGNFNDTVRTAAGADAFAPGFCDGAAMGSTPADGCRSDSDGNDYGVRFGFDWQSGQWLFGTVVDYTRYNARDSVSAFSVTPAFYTFTRELDSTLALRARTGLVFGARQDNLAYVTGGYARGSVSRSFSTDNGVNTFVERDDSNTSGYQVGIGYERRVARNFTLGVEYLMTDLRDRDYTVRSQGPAPETNPFIIENADGTDLRRSSRRMEVDSFRLTANYRF